MFPSRKCMVLDLTFRSSIHFEVNFVNVLCPIPLTLRERQLCSLLALSYSLPGKRLTPLVTMLGTAPKEIKWGNLETNSPHFSLTFLLPNT